MASNPMQRKSRISFILGMIVALLIASAVVALLFMRIKSQNEEISKLNALMTKVYVLNQNVKSGQVLSPEMFTTKSVSKDGVPIDLISKQSIRYIPNDNYVDILIDKTDFSNYYIDFEIT